MDDRKAPRRISRPNGPSLAGEVTGPTTQSIELDGLLANHVTDSGSVDLRGVTPLSIQKLLDAVPIPVLVIDEPLRTVFANKACRKIGPDPKGMLGTPFRTLFPESAEWRDIEAMLHEVFATRSPRIWQSLMGVGNCTVWGRLHVRSIRGPNGRTLLVLVEDLTLEREQLRQNQKHQTILQDANRQLTAEIARRKEVEEALRESESRFRILVESAPFGLSVMAADGNFEFFNHKFTEIFGYTGDDLPNKLAWFHKAYPDSEYRETVFSIWRGDTSEAAMAGEIKPRVFTVRCKNGTDKIINFQQ